MAFLNTILSFIGSWTAIAPDIVAPGKMWHLLILKSFAFITDYGWRIVVFTIIMKLVLSPLDFFQRYKMNKNQKITERLKPTMERIQKQYGDNKQAFSQKQMELNRKEGYSYFSSCLPMIVTMVVFITLWLSMNTVAQYMTLKEYTTLYDEYQTTYFQVIDYKTEDEANSIAQDAVYQLYYDGINTEFVDKLKKDNDLHDDFTLEESDKIQASFLWIKNIWAADVPWGNKAILDWSSFNTAVNKYSKPERHGMDGEVFSGFYNETTYNRVMGKLLNDESRSRTNGYLVLPILVVLLSVASQIVTSLQQKRAGQVNNKGGMATSMKVMMFVMPVMMAAFAIQYASIFTLYMVTNSAVTLVFNFSFSGIIKLIDMRRKTRNHGISTGSTRGSAVPGKYEDVIHYVKGANPHAGEKVVVAATDSVAVEQPKKAKKQKGAATPSVKRSGRPDPNELMGMNMSDKDGRNR